MTHQLPHREAASRPSSDARGGFTLLELVLVMALLAVVMAVSAPSLARFFRGRNLDAEVQRFLALTRYGQSRAIAEGVPMVLWLDAERGLYGLEAEVTYLEEDRLAQPFTLSPDVVMEVDPEATIMGAMQPRGTIELAGNLPAIRFTPDGQFNEANPQYILFRENRDQDAAQLWVALSETRMHYEIRTNQPLLWQRIR